MNTPKVSIVMPTYNRAYVLWKAIQSIQSQTITDWELIIVNDRSTDDTEKLMREFRSDKRIKMIENQYAHSPAGARKFGYEHTTGEFIAYLDSDNTADPSWLETCLLYFDANPDCVFLYPSRNFRLLHLKNGEFVTYIQNTGYGETPTVERLWTHEFDGDPNGLIHRAIAKDKIQGWDDNFPLYEDYDYSLQLATAYPNGLGYVDQVLITYTRLYGEEGICNNATYEQIVENLKRLDEKHKGNEDWSKQTWYKEEIEKYSEFAKKGMKPIERIEEKYGKKK